MCVCVASGRANVEGVEVLTKSIRDQVTVPKMGMISCRGKQNKTLRTRTESLL